MRHLPKQKQRPGDRIPTAGNTMVLLNGVEGTSDGFKTVLKESMNRITAKLRTGYMGRIDKFKYNFYESDDPNPVICPDHNTFLDGFAEALMTSKDHQQIQLACIEDMMKKLLQELLSVLEPKKGQLPLSVRDNLGEDRDMRFEFAAGKITELPCFSLTHMPTVPTNSHIFQQGGSWVD